MIDLEIAKKEFDNYTKTYDLTNKNLDSKYYHTYRVMEICGNLAKVLNLSDEQIDLAKIIGLLHDLGRFEQYTKYTTFSDIKSIDHADLGVQILLNKNFLRKFVKKEEFDNIILKAIENHNKYEIEEGLNEQELLFSKIIRDADKLDILYEGITNFYKEEEQIRAIENETMPNYIIERAKEEKSLKKKTDSKLIERICILLFFPFDMNFKYSFEILQKERYIDRIIDRFCFKNKDTKKQIEELRQIINKYVQKRMIK